MSAASATASIHRCVLLAIPTLFALGASPAAAGPEGGSVVGGAATIQGQGGSAVIVNQSTSSAVINWNAFNIGANESVRFNQPSASSVALNRVVGGLGPSEIMGSLTANGRVFIINRDGILFGPGSVVNTASFLATINDIKNADFMAGRYKFNIPGRPDASIVNQGRITATSGGFAALVAPGVRNSGTITATPGTVALASGNSFTLDMYGDKLITLAVGDSIANKVIAAATGKPLKSLVSNTRRGVISANGGRVATAARAVVDSVINTKGVIRANSISRHNGMIVLNAATGGSKPAGAPAQTIKLAPFVDTYYAPGGGGPKSMEGQFETSRSNLEGGVGPFGPERPNTPKTLDDVRLGRSSYVTVATDPRKEYQGKFHNLGERTYRSPIDKAVHTLRDVQGYTHDTGDAFKGRPDKRDIAVGDFRGWNPNKASALVGPGPAGFGKGGGGDGTVPAWLIDAKREYSQQGFEQNAQRGAVDGALNGFQNDQLSGGRLKLDVNVRAPRGTKVDAGVTGGDFIPADKGITVNREMREE